MFVWKWDTFPSATLEICFWTRLLMEFNLLRIRVVGSDVCSQINVRIRLRRGASKIITRMPISPGRTALTNKADGRTCGWPVDGHCGRLFFSIGRLFEVGGRPDGSIRVQSSMSTRRRGVNVCVQPFQQPGLEY